MAWIDAGNGPGAWRCDTVAVTITRSGSTATALCATAHGLATGDSVLLGGSDFPNYNGTYTVSVIDATQFTFAVSGNPPTTATGHISAYISTPKAALNVGLENLKPILHQLCTAVNERQALFGITLTQWYYGDGTTQKTYPSQTDLDGLPLGKTTAQDGIHTNLSRLQTAIAALAVATGTNASGGTAQFVRSNNPNGQGVLAYDITSAGTVIYLNEGHGITDVQNFIVKIGSEIIAINHRTGNILYVQSGPGGGFNGRGYSSAYSIFPTGVAHTAGSSVVVYAGELAHDITDSDGTITLASGHGIGASPTPASDNPWVFIIGAEKVRGHITGDVITVSTDGKGGRGYAGTTAAAHSVVDDKVRLAPNYPGQVAGIYTVYSDTPITSEDPAGYVPYTALSDLLYYLTSYGASWLTITRVTRGSIYHQLFQSVAALSYVKFALAFSTSNTVSTGANASEATSWTAALADTPGPEAQLTFLNCRWYCYYTSGGFPYFTSYIHDPTGTHTLKTDWLKGDIISAGYDVLVSPGSFTDTDLSAEIISAGIDDTYTSVADPSGGYAGGIDIRPEPVTEFTRKRYLTWPSIGSDTTIDIVTTTPPASKPGAGGYHLTTAQRYFLAQVEFYNFFAITNIAADLTYG